MRLRKSFYKLISFIYICFVIFIASNKFCYASFFDTCNISTKEQKIINYVLKNGNSNLIPANIEEIKDVNFQNAIYLLLFYRDFGNYSFTMPDDAIDVIGYDNIEKINRFKLKALDYVLAKNVDNNELKTRIIALKLNDNEKLRLLQNGIFINRYIENHDFLTLQFLYDLLEKALSYNIVGYEDIKEIKNIYKDVFKDEWLVRQVRVRFWERNINNVPKIIDLIDSKDLKTHIQKVYQFYLQITSLKQYSLKKKNGTIIKKYRNLNQSEISSLCKGYKNIDEYIDLFCLSRHSKDKKLVDDLLSYNKNPKFLPHKWLKYRIIRARDAINGEGDLKFAYEEISNAGFLRGEHLYVQQFLSGFVAFLNRDYHDAIYHFLECTDVATFAESRAKAYYWLGISFLKINNKEKALDAFKQAGEYKFTLYGQLAIEENGLQPEQEIKKYIGSFSKNAKLLCNDVIFIAGYLDQLEKNSKSVSPLLVNYLSKNTTNKEALYNAVDVVANDFDKRIGINFGYYGLRYNVAVPYVSFPSVVFSNDSLINAVIKQESNFSFAISNKGARGVMQIMPSTARVLVKEMGLKYDHRRLLYDEEYNIKIGKYYLEQLLNRFKGNKILTLASYNAGALNVKKWIDKNGDPHDMNSNEKIMLWIEKIPFSQTREYVVKILGSEMVYDVVSGTKTED